MKTYFKFKRSMAGFLILAMLHLCWVSSFAWAEMVATDSVTSSQTENQNPRQRLLDLLNREEVQQELEKHGLSQVEAVARVHSLTDEEVVEVMGKVDQFPNGANGGGGYGGVIAVLVYGGILAGILAVYLLGVFFKGLSCLSDCEAKGGLGYVFKPWWKDQVPEGYEDEPEEDDQEEDFSSSDEDGY